MGGLATAISEKTTRILLEAAHFHPGAVRRTARSLGMHTDASHRFERGTDPEATVDGLNRAARARPRRLRRRGCAGRHRRARRRRAPPRGRPCASRGSSRSSGWRFRRPAVRRDPPRARPRLGARAAGPSRGDRPELARRRRRARRTSSRRSSAVEGYDRLPETLPAPVRAAHVSRAAPACRGARPRRPRGEGLVECQTYSFVVRSRERAVRVGRLPARPSVVENPLGEPFTTLRATPVIGLLRRAQHNVRRGNSDLALFEVGTSFGWNPEKKEKEKISSEGEEKRREDGTGDGRVIERRGSHPPGRREDPPLVADGRGGLGFLRRGGSRRSSHRGPGLG